MPTESIPAVRCRNTLDNSSAVQAILLLDGSAQFLRCNISPCNRLQGAPHPVSGEGTPQPMLYDAYEVQRSFLAGASKLAGLGAGWLNNPANPWGYSSMGPVVAASLEVFAHATALHGKPEFGIERVRVRGKNVSVDEEVLLRKPFGQLK